ncbi:MAG: hypothetical protein ACPG8W_12480 [Candidatus Promineifilaceae bacterium]
MRLKNERQFRPKLYAFLSFLLIVTVVQWQLVRRIDSHVIGRSFDDSFEALWQLRWHHQALFQQGVSPYFNPGIYYPNGWHLATGAQPVWYLVLLSPLVGLFGETVVYNSALLATLVLSAFGVYLLTHKLTGNQLSGILAGLSYSTAPVLVMRLAGHLNVLIGAVFLPFVYVALYNAFSAETTQKHRRWAFYVGLLLTLTFISHWYFLFIATFPALSLLFLRKLWSRRGLEIAVISLATAAATTLPFALITRQALASTYQSRPAPPLAIMEASSVSPARFFTPNPFNNLWHHLFDEMFVISGEQHMVAIGYVTLFFAIAGLLFSQNRMKWLVALSGSIAFSLALGATLYWNNSRVELNALPILSGLQAFFLQGVSVETGHVAIPLPSAMLYKLLPLYRSVRIASRFAIPLQLCMAVLAGLGVTALGEFRPKLRPYLLLAIPLVLFETWQMPYQDFTPVSINDRSLVTDYLQTLAPDTALIEYPLGIVDKLAMYRQSFHNRPIANGYQSYDPDHLAAVRSDLGRWPEATAVPVLRAWDIKIVLINSRDTEQFLVNQLHRIDAIDGFCFVQKIEDSYLSFKSTYVFRVLDVDEPCTTSIGSS